MSQLFSDLDRRAKCGFCDLVYDIYPELDRVENASALQFIRQHARIAHGVRKSSLSAAIVS
jgi:hypothetical protein